MVKCEQIYREAYQKARLTLAAILGSIMANVVIRCWAGERSMTRTLGRVCKMIEILRFVVRVYNFIVRVVREPIGHVIGRMYLLAHGVSIGDNVKVYGLPIVSVSKGSSIRMGNGVVLRSNSRGNAIGVNHEVILRAMTEQATILVGDFVGISGGAICAALHVEIGSNVLLGANVVVADNDFHGMKVEERHMHTRQLTAKPVVIEDGVWVGADAYICKGVTIGRNSVIGAKSVVTKSIPPNAVAVGVPARVVSYLVK